MPKARGTMTVSCPAASYLQSAIDQADPVAEVTQGSTVTLIKPGRSLNFDIMEGRPIGLRRLTTGELLVLNRSKIVVMNLSWIDEDAGDLDQPIAPGGTANLGDDANAAWVVTVI